MHTVTEKEVVTKVPVQVDEYTCDHCGKLLVRKCDPQVGSNVFHPEFKNIDNIPWTGIDVDTIKKQPSKNKRICNSYSKILCDECLNEFYSFFNIKKEDILNG